MTNFYDEKQRLFYRDMLDGLPLLIDLFWDDPLSYISEDGSGNGLNDLLSDAYDLVGEYEYIDEEYAAGLAHEMLLLHERINEVIEQFNRMN